MKIGMARVSTTHQSYDLQVEALEQQGCERIYKEKLSGKDRKRPELEALLKALRKDDVVVVTKIDRLARSMTDLFQIVSEIEQVGAHLQIIDQNVDTSTTTGKLLFNILGSLAEFERSLIKERTQAGLERAKAKGKKLGRKPATTKEQDRQILLAYKDGMSWNEIADTFDISRQAVYRRIRDQIALNKKQY